MENNEKKIEKMEEQVKEEIKNQFTYDELTVACTKLLEKNNILVEKLKQANKFIQTVNVLEYLFRVAELSNDSSKYQFSDDFVIRCYDKIEEILTPSVQKVIPSDDEKKEDE